jgi:5-methylcytosine-specific restriction endonuclease McrA
VKRSELKKHGKKAQEWVRVRAAWIRANPPSHEGHYVCGICGKTVHIDEMELDHIDPRSGAPESFSDFANLQPSHSICNRLKGSKRLQPKVSLQEYELRRKLDL